MTRGARRWLLALVEGCICGTCRVRIVEMHMLPWSSECQQCRVRCIELKDDQ